MSDTRADRSTDKHALLVGALLLVLFFLPVTWGDTPVFAFGLIGTLNGTALAALIVPAVIGALLVLFALLPLSVRQRHAASLGLGLLGAPILVLPEINHLPAPPYVALPLLFLIVIAAGFLAFFSDSRYKVRLAIALLPAACLMWSLVAALSGRISAAYLIVFKTPVMLYLFLEAVFGRK